MADRREIFERVLAPERGRTALVVVDMQRGFLDPGEAMEVPPAREIVPVSVFGSRPASCANRTILSHERR